MQHKYKIFYLFTKIYINLLSINTHKKTIFCLSIFLNDRLSLCPSVRLNDSVCSHILQNFCLDMQKLLNVYQIFKLIEKMYRKNKN